MSDMNKEELAQSEFNNRGRKQLLRAGKNINIKPLRMNTETVPAVKEVVKDTVIQDDTAFVQDREEVKKKMNDEAVQKGWNTGANSMESRPSVSPQAVKGTTITRKTMDQYLQRGSSLNRRFRRETHQAWDEETNPVSFVNWLLSIKPTISSRTWRVYRQAAYYVIEGSPSDHRDAALAILDNDVINISRVPKTKKEATEKNRRTSALREKRFPMEDWNQLMSYLTNFSRSNLAPILKDWLRAGLLTGLRPNEWKMTSIDRVEKDGNTRLYLYVLSCKNTNGRTTGAIRTLDITAFNDSEISIIQRMSDIGRHWQEEGKFTTMQGQCSTLMYNVTTKIWPRRKYSYSLYSTRHQFIANLKTCMEPAEIAAIVGHGSTATAESHYGKRRSGWSEKFIPSIPRAVPEELNMVRDQMKHFYDRVNLEIEAGIRKEKDIPDFPVS